MSERLLSYLIHYLCLALEVGILSCLIRGRQARRLAAVFVYTAAILVTSGLRSFVLYGYGFSSPQYEDFYWLSDVLLALGAFLLICALFRRACSRHPQLWSSLRTMLISVFALVVGVSFISLSKNYDHLFSMFIVEFQQNLYFTCLVLNTLLYLLMAHLESADEQVNLVVCGLGLQFAGPAANLALMYLTHSQGYSGSLFSYLSPLCTLGMLSTWLYAVAHVPSEVPQNVTGKLAVEAATLRPSRAVRLS